MRRAVFLGLGALLAVAGVIWTLQGLDLLGQSGGMNGEPIWAVIGPIVALIGVGLVVAALRTGRTPGDPHP